MVTITVELPTEDATLVEKALDKAVQDLDSVGSGDAAAPDDDTSWSAMQADAVVNPARDSGCVYPGFGHAGFVDVHHVVHWAHGGEMGV